MTTSKSPNRVAAVAYTAAKEALPVYSHKYSPKKFTQPQLAACLVLKEFFTTDYRGIQHILEDSSDLRKILELNEVPHFTTLHKAAQHLLKKRMMRKLLAAVLKMATTAKLVKNPVALAALDGTGLESRHISAYFVRRRNREVKEAYQTTSYTRFPQAGVVCDTASHLVLAAVPGRGPSPDQWHYQQALQETAKSTAVKRLLADAGYDSEANHDLARQQYDIETIIPATKGRRTNKLPATKYRRMMRRLLDKLPYGQRWQVETVFSMVKRNLGSALRAKAYWSQCREIMLKLLTHNVTIVLPG